MRKLFHLLLLSFVLSLAIVACNNGGDKTETTDTTTVKTDTMPPVMDTLQKTDTTKMDTAQTRPVKEGD